MLPKIKIRNKFLKLSFREDRAILAICIGIALVFWMLVKLSQTYRTEKEVKFRFFYPETEKAFTEHPPADIRVQIEGQGWDLLFDYFSNPEVVLTYNMADKDVLTLNSGQLRGDILKSLSSDDIKIIEINNDYLHLTLEDRLSKRVPVVLNAAFSFAPEYDIKGEVTLSPDSVDVYGPGSLLEQVFLWETDSLISNGLKADLVKSVPLEAPPMELELLPDHVEVTVKVEQYTERTLFVPVRIKNAPDSIKIFPEKIKLTCVVGLGQFNDLVPGLFTLEVNMEEISKNTDKNTIPITLVNKPGFVKNVQFNPRSVEFFILEEN